EARYDGSGRELDRQPTLRDGERCPHAFGGRQRVPPRQGGAAQGYFQLLGRFDAAIHNNAEPLEPLGRRSRVPYESRWAPYVRAHEPGQGQLPSGSIRPRGYGSERTSQPRIANVVRMRPWRHSAHPIGTPPSPTV